MEPETIAAVVERGETDDVNDLIDTLEELSISEQLRLFTESYETLLSCMELESGYSRQAVVRVVSALSPAMNRLVAETTVPNYATPGDASFADAITREAALYVAALEDDDGRVREAAIRGIESFCVACRMNEDRDTLEDLYDDLETVGERVGPEKREHVEQAKEHAFSKLH